MVKLKKLDLPGADFEQAKALARAAMDAIRAGILGYALIASRRVSDLLRSGSYKPECGAGWNPAADC
jgi:hypothetical protein